MLFHAVSAAPTAATEVPPTAVTSGWLAGSHTDSVVSLELGGA